MRAFWFLLAAAGCDKVLGLDEVAVGQNETTVFVHGLTRTVINDANHLPTKYDSEFSPATIHNIVAILDDPEQTHSPVQIDPTAKPGEFFFDRKDHTQSYRLIVPSTTADVAPVEYQLSLGTLELFERSWGRSSLPQPPNETAPTAMNTLQYSLSGLPVVSPNATALVESTGLWTETVVATGAPAAMSVTFPWSNATSLYGPVYLLDGSPGIRDRAYFTLHDYGGQYRYIIGYRFDDLVMRVGTPTTVTGTFYRLPQDTCVHVDAELAQATQAVMNAGLGTPSASWKLEAVPDVSMGPELSFVVAEGAVSPLDVTFGVPFGGYGVVLAMEANVAHPILAPGATMPDVRFDGSTHWIAPSATSPSATNTCPPTTTLRSSVPVPTALLASGASIMQDRELEIDRTRPLQLAWTPNGTGTAPLYRADLYELIDDAGRTFLHHVVRWLTTNVSPEGNPIVEIDPTYMPAGGSYVISVADLIGFSAVANGDFSQIDSTYAQGYAWSGVITVTK